MAVARERATVQTVLDLHDPCRLVGLVAKHELNGHIVDRKEALEGGRHKVCVLSTGKQLSVPSTACERIARVTGRPRLSKHDANVDELRVVLEEALAMASSDSDVDFSDIIECILRCMVVQPVDMAQVRAVCASSSNGSGPCHPSHTLDPSTSNWWISSSERGGRDEYVTYELGPANVIVDFFHITIPPLPSGPLSVRTFHLQIADESTGPWERATSDLMTLDVASRQWVALEPPLEARYVRVVCGTNAAHHELTRINGDATGLAPTCIGYFEAGFAAWPV